MLLTRGMIYIKKAFFCFVLFFFIIVSAVAIYNYCKVDYSDVFPKLVGTWESEDESTTITFTYINGKKAGTRTTVKSREKIIEKFEWKISRGYIVLIIVDSKGNAQYTEKYSIGVTEHYLGLKNKTNELRLKKI